MTSAIELFANAWVHVTLEPDGHLVRMRRTAERLTPEALSTLGPLIRQHLPMARRANQRLLFDTREAPLLGDDGAETPIGTTAHQLFDGFERVAVLVSTAVGKLQATRFSRQFGTHARILDDEAAALAYLRG